jgi:hypothetical protein
MSLAAPRRCIQGTTVSITGTLIIQIIVFLLLVGSR